MLLAATFAGSSVAAATGEEALFDASDAVPVGEGSCGDEQSDGEIVLCGGELLAGRVDSSLLRMSKHTCSALLDELFDALTCQPGEADCDRALPGTPGPQLPQVVPATSGAAMLASSSSLDDLGAAAAGRATTEVDPLSIFASPPVPPPRAPGA
jgi:hypothetical protein